MKSLSFTQETVERLNSVINSLNAITTRCEEKEVKQLAILNKLRKMNGKQQVSSFTEHRELKKLGL